VAESLAEDEKIAFNAGNHTEMIKLSYKDFERLVQPRVLKISRKAVSFPHDPEDRWVEDY
jgi:Ala-tRNA(Pro) deacylase